MSGNINLEGPGGIKGCHEKTSADQVKWGGGLKPYYADRYGPGSDANMQRSRLGGKNKKRKMMSSVKKTCKIPADRNSGSSIYFIPLPLSNHLIYDYGLLQAPTLSASCHRYICTVVHMMITQNLLYICVYILRKKDLY